MLHLNRSHFLAHGCRPVLPRSWLGVTIESIEIGDSPELLTSMAIEVSNGLITLTGFHCAARLMALIGLTSQCL